MIFFVAAYMITTFATLLYVPHMSATIRQCPVLLLLPLVNVLAIANIPRAISKGKDFKAFLSSCVSLFSLMALFGVGMMPNLVYSSLDPQNSLTLYNAASSHKTLGIMLVIALIGMPLVVGYTVSIYWIFRGKVRLENTSY